MAVVVAWLFARANGMNTCTNTRTTLLLLLPVVTATAGGRQADRRCTFGHISNCDSLLRAVAVASLGLGSIRPIPTINLGSIAELTMHAPNQTHTPTHVAALECLFDVRCLCVNSL